MPSGIPVATVAIDGAENAAILAAQILSITNSNIAQQLLEERNVMAKIIEEKNANLQYKLSQRQ